MATGRLTEIVKARRESGLGVTSSLAGGVKERLKEKLDPRRLFNQNGILTALFPKLRSYRSGAPEKLSTGGSSNQVPSSSDSLSTTKPLFDSINKNTKIIAMNSMVLPLIQKDTNLMRQTLKKIVKAMQVKKKFIPITKTRPVPVRNVPASQAKGLETEKEEPEKEKGPIDILKDLVKSIGTMAYLVGQALTEGLSGLTDKIIKGVISGVKGLFTVSKLATSMIGRFMLPILGFMASPAGLAVMLGAAFFAILYRGFTSEERDAEKRKEYEELKEKLTLGIATESDKRRLRYLEGAGYGKEDIMDPNKIVQPTTGLTQSGKVGMSQVGFIKDVLAQKTGTYEYLSDEDLKKTSLGRTRKELQEWYDEYLQWEKSGKKGVMRDLNEPTTSPFKVSSPISNFLEPNISNVFSINGNDGKEKHEGLDIKGRIGDPIYAPEGGTVRVKSEPRGFGNYVEIYDDKGKRKHLLAHLSGVSVKDGQKIEKGAEIGKMGSTGKSTGPHLHWETYDASGKPIDPKSWLMFQNYPEMAEPFQKEDPNLSNIVSSPLNLEDNKTNDPNFISMGDSSSGSQTTVNRRIDSPLNFSHPFFTSVGIESRLIGLE